MQPAVIDGKASLCHVYFNSLTNFVFTADSNCSELLTLIRFGNDSSLLITENGAIL